MLERLRRNQSLLIAAVLVGGLLVWMWPAFEPASTPTDGGASPAPSPERVAAPTRVRVTTLAAEDIQRELVVQGHTEPARAVTLKAEVDGRVVELGAERGARVAAGDLVVRLDARDREARVREARALVRQRELQYEAVRRLERQSFQTQTQVAESLADLEAARATLRQAEVALANTEIRAPFDGVLDRRPVEIGAYVNDGAEVARLIDDRPMVVAGHVAQQELVGLRTGLTGHAQLVTGESVTGTLRYVAAESDAATRTFRVELEVPNPDGRLVAGVTTVTRLVIGSTRAHLVSPAVLALDDASRLGVKLVDDDDTVRFAAVRVVKSGDSGVWVTGLPERPRVITVGQGFVREGERVVPVEQPAGDGASAS